MSKSVINGMTTLFMLASAAAGHDPAAGDFSKLDPRDVRVVSYNVDRALIANSSADVAFGRILTALSPDVVCFQEIPENVSDTDLADRMNSLLPTDGDWHVHSGLATGIRTAIASRYPLALQREDTYPPSDTRGVTIALVSLPDSDYPVDLYVLGVHLKCCGNPGGREDASRQRSADAIANWLADARGLSRPSGDNVTLAAGTPMLVLGDFNFVGGPRPELALRTGDILDEAEFGPDAPGDWDHSHLLDVAPRDPTTGDDFTWQGNSSFPPGRLDRFYLTDSAAPIATSFVLNTDTMTPEALSAAGLLASDTLRSNTSDHLPIVLDLRLWSARCVGDLNGNGGVGLDDLLILIGDFGNPGPDAPGDLDGDGDADLADLVILLNRFGATCN